MSVTWNPRMTHGAGRAQSARCTPDQSRALREISSRAPLSTKPSAFDKTGGFHVGVCNRSAGGGVSRSSRWKTKRR
jgi:hypothetical protein